MLTDVEEEVAQCVKPIKCFILLFHVGSQFCLSYDSELTTAAVTDNLLCERRKQDTHTPVRLTYLLTY